jgi:hypothetical protein
LKPPFWFYRRGRFARGAFCSTDTRATRVPEAVYFLLNIILGNGTGKLGPAENPGSENAGQNLP